MKKLKMNFSIVKMIDGGQFNVSGNVKGMNKDDWEEVYDLFEENCNDEGEKDEEWTVIDNFFNDDERTVEQKEQYELVKRSFNELIGNKKGKYYGWGDGMGLNLMFIEK